MQASRFQVRIIIPKGSRLDLAWLAVSANNVGYLLESQKSYTSEKSGDTLVYLFFSSKSASKPQASMEY